jgi:hypothetical protein
MTPKYPSPQEVSDRAMSVYSGADLLVDGSKSAGELSVASLMLHELGQWLIGLSEKAQRRALELFA